MMLAGQTDAAIVVDNLARRQQRQHMLEVLAEITHRALLAPAGQTARGALIEWGFPEMAVGRLDVGFFPEPAFVAWELRRRGIPAPEAEDAAVLEPSWSGRVVGPWRSPRGRILTFFAWTPESTDRPHRYALGQGGCPTTLFGLAASPSPPIGHLWVVEGLLDVLLAMWFGLEDVAGTGGPLWRLSVQRLARLAASGIRQLTLIPADDEEGRRGVLTALDNADGMERPSVEVFVVDPAMMAGARDLGELVLRRECRALAGVEAWRMEGDVYRVAMVPWQ